MNRKTILIIAGVVALGGVAFAGYKIWKHNKDKKDSNTDENKNFVEEDDFMVIDESTFSFNDNSQLMDFDGVTEGEVFNEAFGL